MPEVKDFVARPDLQKMDCKRYRSVDPKVSEETICVSLRRRERRIVGLTRFRYLRMMVCKHVHTVRVVSGRRKIKLCERTTGVDGVKGFCILIRDLIAVYEPDFTCRVWRLIRSLQAITRSRVGECSQWSRCGSWHWSSASRHIVRGCFVDDGARRRDC